jgi:flagellar basal body-associated protein FliL
MSNKSSHKYQPTPRSERLVPVILVLLLLVLVATIAFVILSVLGVTPAV